MLFSTYTALRSKRRVTVNKKMEPRNLTDQIMRTLDNMIDPHADIEQRVSQMRAQLAALSELPRLIQERVDAVKHQIDQFSQMDAFKQVHQEQYVQITQPGKEIIHPIERIPEEPADTVEITEIESPEKEERFIEIQKPIEVKSRTPERAVEIRITKPSLAEEELAKEEVKRMLEEKIKMEKEKELIHKINFEQEQKIQPIPTSIQTPQRARSPSPRPQPVFGPAPKERPLGLSGGRKWRRSHEEYDEEQIQETLTAQAEVIKGKAIGVNFMKYEKPPPPLDHLQHSEVYKVVHNMDETPLKKVAMLKPVIAEADYRERARSMSPCPNGR
ncbi:unnamed protein product, partial [Brenthis ino]